MSKEKVVLSGEVTVPGDKSITHRAVLFGALAEGKSTVRTNALGRDNLATIRVMGQLGVRITGALTPEMLSLARDEGLNQFAAAGDDYCELEIYGEGLHSLKAPQAVLDCGNAGTLARLLTGVLAGQDFAAEFSGDESLRSRPFRRVVEPLTAMGATFSGDRLPIKMRGGKVRAIEYTSPQASAQVKSAVLLAGLYASGCTTVCEPRRSRDHTERLLSAMGCPLEENECEGKWRVVLPACADPQGPEKCGRKLSPVQITVPGDYSSAAFLLVAGSIFSGSEILVRQVGVNPTRTGLTAILKRMGADLTLHKQHLQGGEAVADIRVVASALRGVVVSPEEVVLAIDEIPILCVAAAVAHGETVFTGAEELRVKESDRLARSKEVLQYFGVEVEELRDGLRIIGNPNLAQEFSARAVGAAPPAWQTTGDHRIAMMGAVLELFVRGGYELRDVLAVETSFPGFSQCLQQITRKVEC